MSAITNFNEPLITKSKKWEKLGKILTPNKGVEWMRECLGSSFALQVGSTSYFSIYVTGRDSLNRSQIGKIKINIEKPIEVLEVSSSPVLSFGELGTFDENGVSYPWLVRSYEKVLMYYVGWMPTVLTPFQNHIGLATENKNGFFERVSKAPIFERNNDDYLSIGSCCVLAENDIWKMWYTSFLEWGRLPSEPKHRYLIKYAESADGIIWNRGNKICINFQNQNEYAIAKPSVLKIKNVYHMWYTYRGVDYKIGYAYSEDGVNWIRRDDIVGIDLSSNGWDSTSQCYPQVFQYKNSLYMLYCGNSYGKEGLGIARLDL
ncbi:MAG: hypothetical protein HY094_09455 [Candidatus Melainabacteria bacterium]|nr:hypothetical protein [Candidatus Melainabacteria bacterium]